MQKRIRAFYKGDLCIGLANGIRDNSFHFFTCSTSSDYFISKLRCEEFCKANMIINSGSINETIILLWDEAEDV